MSESADETSELARTASRLSAGIVEGVQLRLELFALEFGEERRRVVELVAVALALALAVFMLLLCVNAALLIFFWESHRVAVAGGLLLFYASIALGCLVFLRRRSRRQGEAFAATRRVLEQDRSALHDLR